MTADRLGVVSVMVDKWRDRLTGGVEDDASVLSVFVRLLKVAQSLGSAAAQRFIEGRLVLPLEPALAAEIPNGMLFQSVSAFLRRATITERSVFRGLIDQEIGIESRSDDNSPGPCVR